MTRLPTWVFCTASLLVVAPVPAIAQTQPDAPPAAAQDDPCRAQPDPGDNTGNADEQAAQDTGKENADVAAADPSLSEKLDRCNGVLSPPPAGDPELVEPAPNEGKTPVIPPGAVPEQQPDEPG